MTDVKPFDENPRTIKDKNLSGLRASINRFGMVDLIVWNRKTGNIISGHQRYRVLVESGIQEADMIVVEFDSADELAANLSLNNPEIEGEWDDPIVDLLGRVESVDPDFFSDGNMEELRKAVEKMIPPPTEKDETDTECPCCGHRWMISDVDVVVMTKEEQENHHDLRGSVEAFQAE